MIWDRRGSNLYAERDGKAYLIRNKSGAWVLWQRWLNDENWEVVGEYNTQQEAKDAAT